jgi:DNA repair exonuclease SbcCD ATPase subunit
LKEDAMDEYIHQQNLILFKKQIAEVKDEVKRNMLMKLLAEEQAKEPLPKRGSSPTRGANW